ncbi:MAG: hypothetical protein ACOYU0_08650 [Nitrospirota bacterium]
MPIYAKQAVGDADVEVGRVFDNMTREYIQTVGKANLETVYSELITLIKNKLETATDPSERSQYLNAIVEIVKAKEKGIQAITLGSVQSLSPLQQQLLYERQMEALKKPSFLEELLKDAIGEAVAAKIWKEIYK